jgi:hypothetical protein
MQSRKFSSRIILPALFLRLTRATLLLALFAGIQGTQVQAQATPDGHWEATMQSPNGEMELSLDLARHANTDWIASMGMPAQNATGMVVAELSVNGNSVKFVAVELMMSKVELTLGAEGKLTGTFTGPFGPAPPEMRHTTPVEFKRTGEAKVELIPPSPAVSKEMEGDWEGVLQAPNGKTFRMIFHFRNQAGHTVAATIDTPDTNAIGLPLNDVKQTGKDVSIGVRIAHSDFKGTLNEQGTEMAGQFGSGGNGMPLTLKKK